MKFYTIAMLLLMLNVGMSIINYIDVMNYQTTYQSDWVDEVGNVDALNQSYAPSSVEADASNTAFGNFKKGASMFITTLFYATIGFPWMFRNFGLDWGLALLLSAPIFVIYIVGLIQLFSKQPLGGMR